MARAKFIDDPDFEIALSNLAKSSPAITAKVLRAGAAVIADEMRRRLEGVLSPQATGELLDGFGFTPVKYRKDGSADVHIGFDGYDSQQVPNQLKARVLESGARFKSGKVRKPRPFARPAVKASREKAIRVMRETAEAEIQKITKR